MEREYKGERIDRTKMNACKRELEKYIYNDNAEKLIFGDGEKQQPNYKIYIPKEDWDNLKKR